MTDSTATMIPEVVEEPDIIPLSPEEDISRINF
jgi:hypothetical protein